MRAHLPDKNYFIGKTVPSREGLTVKKWIASGNDGHLFRAYSRDLGRDLACKVIPRENLQHSPDGKELWREEILKANMLRNAVVVKVEHLCEWPKTPLPNNRVDPHETDCIALISEFIEGVSLKQFIASQHEEITISFITQWFETILNLFYEMKFRGVTHGDFHLGNILVEDQSSYNAIGPRFVFRVTDFGVGDTTSEPRFKDDYLQLADCLSQLLRLVDFQACSPLEKFTFNILRHHFIERHLVESDPTRDPLSRNPQELIRKLRHLDADYAQTAAQSTTRLLTPFDFLSCEQVGEAASLLHSLYSDRFLGLSEIESQNNVVVTGPRGCGKSTVFRSLSLDQRILVNDADPELITYIGVYYQCNDLYFAFPRYANPERDEALGIPLHFITATLLAKLFESFENWANKHYEGDFKQAEPSAVERIWSSLGLSAPQTPDRLSLKSVIAALNKQRSKSLERQRFANDIKRSIGFCFGPEILVRTCDALLQSFPFLENRPIYFFIDDYSSPKVTKALQLNLNRVFMQRSPSCFFKLSTESPVSFEKQDIDGKIYVESREFILHNLGLVYLHADAGPKLAFIEDVFRRRLRVSAEDFPVEDIRDLVGTNSEQNDNDLARRIREGEKPYLWGIQILSRLCSGDVHYLISLVGDMVRLSGGASALKNVKNKIPHVPKSIQTRAIREAAGGFLKNLRGVPRCGVKLVAIVEAFGNVSYSHLRYLDSRNEKGTPPKQATRIEPYAPIALSENAQQLYDELLRYSVFIEDFRGKSRRGSVVPRLFLRRFLIPHFNLTFSTRDSIEIEPHDFEIFLTSTDDFERKFRLKSEDDISRLLKHTDADQKQTTIKFDEPPE